MMDAHEIEQAARLWPSSSDQAPADAAAPRPVESIADRLYGDRKPAPPAPPEGADMGRRLFSPQGTYSLAVPDAAGEALGIEVVPFREVLADVDAEPDDAAQLLGLMRQHGAPDATMRQAWRSQAEALGIDAADLRLAREFVQRDPRIAEFLEATGLGDHPRVVERVVELARRARLRRA